MLTNSSNSFCKDYPAATGGVAAPTGAGAPGLCVGAPVQAPAHRPKHGAARTHATRGGDVRSRAAHIIINITLAPHHIK
jgi:hypothetical protein